MVRLDQLAAPGSGDPANSWGLIASLVAISAVLALFYAALEDTRTTKAVSRFSRLPWVKCLIAFLSTVRTLYSVLVGKGSCPPSRLCGIRSASTLSSSSSTHRQQLALRRVSTRNLRAAAPPSVLRYRGGTQLCVDMT